MRPINPPRIRITRFTFLIETRDGYVSIVRVGGMLRGHSRNRENSMTIFRIDQSTCETILLSFLPFTHQEA